MKRFLARPAVAIVILVAAVAPLLSGPAAACGSVPCGYINPIITIDLEGVSGQTFETRAGQALKFTGSITYTFDASQEGFTAPNPGETIVITFEFPRRPQWSDITVEPKSIEVPILPQYFETDPSDPENVRIVYRFTSPLSVEVVEREPPTLAPERPTVKATIFAKSTESGFYKSGYGLKQFKLKPLDAAFAAAVDPLAGLNVRDYIGRDLALQERSFATTTVTLRSTTPVNLWSPTSFEVTLRDPRGETSGATVIAAVSTDSGELLQSTSSLEAVEGKAHFKFTFPESGRHTIAVAALPPPGAQIVWDPFVAVFDVPIGFDDAYVLPGKLYTATHREFPRALSADAAGTYGQYEKFIEIPVYDGVRTIEVGLTAGNTAPAAPGETSNGASSYFAEIIDPQGKPIATQTFGAANPARSLAVDAVPSTGVYVLHIYGTGASRGAAGAYYEANVRVTYDEKNVFPPIPASTGGAHEEASLGRLSLAVVPSGAAPWRPVPWKVGLDDAAGAGRLLLTVSDGDGRIVHSSGMVASTSAEIPVTLPSHGIFRASLLVLDEPRAEGAYYDAVLASFPITLDAGGVADVVYEGGYEAFYTTTFDGAGTFERTMPFTLFPGLRSGGFGIQFDGNTGFLLKAALLDSTGRVEKEMDVAPSQAAAAFDLTTLAPGDYSVRVSGHALATPASPLGMGGNAVAEYAGPVVLPNPLYAGPLAPLDGEPARTPGFEAGVGLVALAALAAVLRRRHAR